MPTRSKPSPAPVDVGGFDLGWHLPHLLRRAHFEAEARFGPIYGPQATSRQLALLVSVARLPGATQSAIAREIGLDLNTCSDLVRRTVQRGWLRRERSAADARARVLQLTPAGAALVTEHALPRAAPYAERVAQALSPQERRTLARLLRKLLDLHG